MKEYKHTIMEKHPLRDCWMVWMPELPYIPPYFGSKRVCEKAREFAEKKVEELLKAQTMNDVSKYFYYMWNKWNEDECKEVYADDFYPHFWGKWCDICDKYGVYGAAERFYAELSESNRDKIVERAKELYD